MTLHLSENNRSPLNPFMNTWVTIGTQGIYGQGVLVEENTEEGYVMLNPHVRSRTIGSLPARLEIVKESRILFIPKMLPLDVLPETEENIKYTINETNREYKIAVLEREQQLENRVNNLEAAGVIKPEQQKVDLRYC